MFLDQNFYSDRVFECPDEVIKAHLCLLHIKTLIEGKLINRVLIDGGSAISLLRESMLERFDKGNKDLVRTNVVLTDYNGKSTITKGVVMLNVHVRTIDRPIMFVVVPSKASYNALLGRDWIHGVGAIPLTLHQKLILWKKEVKTKEVVTDDSYCYVESFHVDFKIYNEKVKPLEVNANFDPSGVEGFIIGRDGLYLVLKVGVDLTSHDL